MPFDFLGDSYRLDCDDANNILPLFADDSFDLIATDIPYNVVNRPIGKMNCNRKLDKGLADSTPIDLEWFVRETSRIAPTVYVWCSTEQAGQLRDLYSDVKMTTRLCVWVKSNPSPLNGEKMWLSGIETCIFARRKGSIFNRHCKVPAWTGPVQRLPEFPCPKPIWLMQELVTASTNPGDRVLDPYMGSGSTGVACMQEDRLFYGVEKVKNWHDLAEKRIKKALLKQG